MTYQNDPKLHPRNSYPMAEDRTNAGWIAGGIAALAVIMGLLFMFGRDDRSTTAAKPSSSDGTGDDRRRSPCAD